MSPADLLRRVAACGYRVEVADGRPGLVPTRPGCELPPRLLAELRRHREAVMAYLDVCEVCGRDVSDPGDRERLDDPAFCDRGGANEVTDGLGVYHEARPRCPYKEGT